MNVIKYKNKQKEWHTATKPLGKSGKTKIYKTLPGSWLYLLIHTYFYLQFLSIPADLYNDGHFCYLSLICAHAQCTVYSSLYIPYMHNILRRAHLFFYEVDLTSGRST
jgi:hypothetical protein